MKIMGTDLRNGRAFVVEQVIAGGGHSPWDGRPFSANYAITLVDALADAERAGNELERALATIADIKPDMTLDSESILGPLRAQLDRLDARAARPA